MSSPSGWRNKKQKATSQIACKQHFSPIQHVHTWTNNMAAQVLSLLWFCWGEHHSLGLNHCVASSVRTWRNFTMSVVVSHDWRPLVLLIPPSGSFTQSSSGPSSGPPAVLLPPGPSPGPPPVLLRSFIRSSCGPPPGPPPDVDLMLLYLTSSFATALTTAATRGRNKKCKCGSYGCNI